MPTSGEARIRPTSTYNLRSRPLPKTKSNAVMSKNKENNLHKRATGQVKKSKIPTLVRTTAIGKSQTAEVKTSELVTSCGSRVKTVPDFAKLHKSWQTTFNKGKACTKKKCTEIREFGLTQAGTVFQARYDSGETNENEDVFETNEDFHADEDAGEDGDFIADEMALQTILSGVGVTAGGAGRATVAGVGGSVTSQAALTRQTLGALPRAFQGRPNSVYNVRSQVTARTEHHARAAAQPPRVDAEQYYGRREFQRKGSLAEQQQAMNINFQSDDRALASILNNTGADLRRRAPATRQTIGGGMGSRAQPGDGYTGRPSQGAVRSSVYCQRPRHRNVKQVYTDFARHIMSRLNIEDTTTSQMPANRPDLDLGIYDLINSASAKRTGTPAMAGRLVNVTSSPSLRQAETSAMKRASSVKESHNTNLMVGRDVVNSPAYRLPMSAMKKASSVKDVRYQSVRWADVLNPPMNESSRMPMKDDLATTLFLDDDTRQLESSHSQASSVSCLAKQDVIKHLEEKASIQRTKIEEMDEIERQLELEIKKLQEEEEAGSTPPPKRSRPEHPGHHDGSPLQREAPSWPSVEQDAAGEMTRNRSDPSANYGRTSPTENTEEDPPGLGMMDTPVGLRSDFYSHNVGAFSHNAVISFPQEYSQTRQTADIEPSNDIDTGIDSGYGFDTWQQQTPQGTNPEKALLAELTEAPNQYTTGSRPQSKTLEWGSSHQLPGVRPSFINVESTPVYPSGGQPWQPSTIGGRPVPELPVKLNHLSSHPRMPSEQDRKSTWKSDMIGLLNDLNLEGPDQRVNATSRSQMQESGSYSVIRTSSLVEDAMRSAPLDSLLSSRSQSCINRRGKTSAYRCVPSSSSLQSTPLPLSSQTGLIATPQLGSNGSHQQAPTASLAASGIFSTPAPIHTSRAVTHQSMIKELALKQALSSRREPFEPRDKPPIQTPLAMGSMSRWLQSTNLHCEAPHRLVSPVALRSGKPISKNPPSATSSGQPTEPRSGRPVNREILMNETNSQVMQSQVTISGNPASATIINSSTDLMKSVTEANSRFQQPKVTISGNPASATARPSTNQKQAGILERTVSEDQGSLSLGAELLTSGGAAAFLKSKMKPVLTATTNQLFQEALLDEECALYACRLPSKFSPQAPANRNCFNPVAKILMDGDDMHFVPIQTKGRVYVGTPVGSAFKMYNGID